MKRDYDNIPAANRKIAGAVIAYEPIQYLYMRSFFIDMPVPADVKSAFSFYLDNAKQDWVKQTTYMRALVALGIEPAACHMNEGHAAFQSLERARILMERHGMSFAEAAAITRAVRRYLTTGDPGSGFVQPIPRRTPAGGGGGAAGCVDPPLRR